MAIISGVKARFVSAQSRHDKAKDKSHWVGSEGVIDALDANKAMSFEYEGKWRRTAKVEEVCIFDDKITVRTADHNYVMERI